MSDDKDKGASDRGSRTEAIRSAVEQAFGATAQGASPVRERAQELADELVGAASRLRDVFEDLRPDTGTGGPSAGDELIVLRERVAELERRVASLERAPAPAAAKPARKPTSSAKASTSAATSAPSKARARAAKGTGAAKGASASAGASTAKRAPRAGAKGAAKGPTS